MLTAAADRGLLYPRPQGRFGEVQILGDHGDTAITHLGKPNGLSLELGGKLPSLSSCHRDVLPAHLRALGDVHESGGGSAAALQLNLFAVDRRGGTDLIPDNMAAWSSSDDRVAEVNRQGRLTPRRVGSLTIAATYAGKSVMAVFSVVD